MNRERAAAYRQSMRHLQETARHLYRAHRLQPSEEGLTMLQVTAALLREVTQTVQRLPKPLIGIIQGDSDGRVIRQSFA